MTTAIQTMTEIQTQAKATTPAPLVHAAMKVGEWIRQGDIYIRRVKVNAAHGDKRHPAQLVEGTAVGARHVARAPAIVFEATRQGGNVIVVSNAPWCLAHPEHAHHVIPAGTYEVIRQQDLATRRAVAD